MVATAYVVVFATRVSQAETESSLPFILTILTCFRSTLQKSLPSLLCFGAFVAATAYVVVFVARVLQTETESSLSFILAFTTDIPGDRFFVSYRDFKR